MKTNLLRRISAMLLAVVVTATTLFSMSGVLKVQAGTTKEANITNSTTFNYTEIGIGADGWTTGTTTTDVVLQDGVITGKTGSTSDPSVLTLNTGVSGNTFVLDAGSEYTFTVTYKSAAKLMFFVGNWIAVDDASAASDWKTITTTLSATSGTLPIYIQNWGGDTPEGDFAIKDMRISKVANDVKLDFVQYDYTNIEIGADGWKNGKNTEHVKNTNGVITGETTSAEDATVLQLETGSASNRFQLEANTEYKLSVTFKSEVKLMFFCGDWKAITSGATASEEWTKASATFTTGASTTNLPIYIQNWDGEHPAGAFSIKEIYLSKVADTKTIKAGATLGTLPGIMLSPSDKYHKMVWKAKGALLSETTVYTEDMGTVVVATEMEKEHKLKKVDGQKADCQHDGWKDYYICENTDCMESAQSGFYYDSDSKLAIFTDFEAWKLSEGKLPSTGECAYTVYQSDETSHWLVCQACGNDKPGSKTSHKCDQKTEAEKYLKSKATCKAPITYYQSCICGYCDKTPKTPTFTVGKAKAHQWTDKDADVTKHICSECKETQEHTYDGDICTVCGYDMANAVHFVQFDYGTIPASDLGWQAGETIRNITNKNGVISGTLGDGSDVLTLATTEKNTFMMKKGVKYRLTLTYKSDAKLMIFVDGWNPLMPQATAAQDWKTLSITVTPEIDRKLTIYVQNWDGEVKSGKFQLKDIYLSKVSDAKVLKDGHEFGTLPKFESEVSDVSHKLVWKVKNPRTGKMTQISEKTKFNRANMGGYVFATEVFAPHGKDSHWWTDKGATPSVHKCSECKATQEHTYVDDVCTICGYDMSNAVQFVQYDYGTVPVSFDGWQAGITTKNVSNKNGVISGSLGSEADVLTLATTEDNTFVMKKGVKYRLTLTYKSEAKLMIFADNWNAMMPQPTAAKEWKTLTMTITPDADRKLTIYVQNWDSEVKSGKFQLKDIYLSKVSDAKVLKDGHKFGTLPKFESKASDESHELVWKVKNPRTGKMTQISEKTKFNRANMGGYVFATEILAPHSEQSHWWTDKGASITKHKCSVCGETQEHTYEADVCTVCGYDMSKTLKYNICNYTTVAIGDGGWEVGSTTKNVKYKDGVITGKTGSTSDPAVMSLYAHSDLNPYMMEAGVTYRVSITYKSDATLMIFCDEWKNFTNAAEASKEWKTMTLTIMPATARKLAIYIQNWDHTNPVGTFALKDLTIAKVSDSTVLKDGKAIGSLPNLTYSPTDEFHEFIWYIKDKSGNGYIKITPDTKYNKKTMGTEILPIETKVYHTVLNYVRCDMQEVDSWSAGEAVANGTFTHKDGVLKATLGSNTVGKTAMSFSDGKQRLELESGVEYKVILTYKSSKAFGVFMNLKSNAWTEAPGKCLPSIGNEWKTVTATFKSAAGDTFNGALIQSWNDEKPYTLEIKDFCIVKADDTRKFTGNESLGNIPACQGEDDALGRYVYQWNLCKKDGSTLLLSSKQTISTLTSAAGGQGALYAKEDIKCVYHMDDGTDYGNPATCTESGWSSYWRCQTCGKYFSDNLCKNEITELKKWKNGEGKLEPTGHVHTMELLSLDGTVYYYCECHKLFAKEGDSLKEVSFDVLDKPGVQKDTDNTADMPAAEYQTSTTATFWILVCATVLVLAAGVLLVILLRKGKVRQKS